MIEFFLVISSLGFQSGIIDNEKIKKYKENFFWKFVHIKLLFSVNFIKQGSILDIILFMWY